MAVAVEAAAEVMQAEEVAVTVAVTVVTVVVAVVVVVVRPQHAFITLRATHRHHRQAHRRPNRPG